MDNIPSQFKKLAESAELYDQSEKVGQKFGLMIDQIGEMDAEIRGVLLGVFKPADFADHLVEKLEINKDLAEQITTEVNKEIFSVVRENLQKETESNMVSAVEKAGDFNIERGYGHSTEKHPEDSDKKETLEHIEKPPSPYEHHVEPLVDHLLTKPTSVPMEKIEKTVETPIVPEKKIINNPKPRSGPDPYREAIE